MSDAQVPEAGSEQLQQAPLPGIPPVMEVVHDMIPEEPMSELDRRKIVPEQMFQVAMYILKVVGRVIFAVKVTDQELPLKSAVILGKLCELNENGRVHQSTYGTKKRPHKLRLKVDVAVQLLEHGDGSDSGPQTKISEVPFEVEIGDPFLGEVLVGTVCDFDAAEFKSLLTDKTIQVSSVSLDETRRDLGKHVIRTLLVDSEHAPGHSEMVLPRSPGNRHMSSSTSERTLSMETMQEVTGAEQVT